jgi:hypothetical protein
LSGRSRWVEKCFNGWARLEDLKPLDASSSFYKHLLSKIIWNCVD